MSPRLSTIIKCILPWGGPKSLLGLVSVITVRAVVGKGTGVDVVFNFLEGLAESTGDDVFGLAVTLVEVVLPIFTFFGLDESSMCRE